MKILVIIVNYGGDGNLKECVGSLDELRKANGNFVLDVRVIDNNKNNVGFAGGVNKGIKMADRPGGLSLRNYDWVWVLNPDTIVKSKIKKIDKSLDSRPTLSRGQALRGDDRALRGENFDIFSPVVYDAAGEVWFGGGKINRWTGECVHCVQIQNLKCKSQNDSEKIKNINTNQCNPIRENPTVLIRENQENSNEAMEQWNNEAEWVSGCSMFMRSTVFEKIGLFDEKFFLFYEDVDFCMRAGKAGFKIGVVDDLPFRVIHKVSQSVNKLGEKERYKIEWESKKYLIKKHWSYFWPTALPIAYLRYLKHKILLNFIKGI